MPEYLYACDNDKAHRVWLEHRMTDNPQVICPECGNGMHRVPLAPRVNWNGILQERSKEMQGFFDTVDERQEAYLKHKEKQQ